MKNIFMISFLIFSLVFLPDPDTKILLQGNTLPITDETGRIWTNSGVTVSASQYKFGWGSLAFNGNAQITTADFADSYLGDGRPATFDWWMYLNALPISGNKISIYNQGTDITHFVNIEVFNNGGRYALVLETANGGTSVAAQYLTGLTTGTWHHYAVQKNGSQYTFYQDCVLLTDGQINQLSFTNFSTPVRIGKFLNGGHGVNGFIDQFRLSRVIRFTGSTCTLPGENGGATSTPTITPTPTYTATPTFTPTVTATPTNFLFSCPVGEVQYNLLDPQNMELWCEE